MMMVNAYNPQRNAITSTSRFSGAFYEEKDKKRAHVRPSVSTVTEACPGDCHPSETDN